jgi:hypothetical protein
MKLRIYYGGYGVMFAVGVHQCRLISFAFQYQGWHTFKKDRATLRAVNALEKKGCLEVKGDQFRFRYPSK